MRREEAWIFSERAAVRPLHAKAFFVIHRVPADKDLLWNEMNREIKRCSKAVLRNVFYSFPGYFTYSFADFCVKKRDSGHCGPSRHAERHGELNEKGVKGEI